MKQGEEAVQGASAPARALEGVDLAAHPDLPRPKC